MKSTTSSLDENFTQIFSGVCSLRKDFGMLQLVVDKAIIRFDKWRMKQAFIRMIENCVDQRKILNLAIVIEKIMRKRH